MTEKKVKPLIIEIEMDKLSAIARYYGFPSAVFFQPMEQWEKRKDTTRLEELRKDSEKLDRIREVLGDGE